MTNAKRKPKINRSRGGIPADWDSKMIATNDLREPNKAICIYCRQQAATRDEIVHRRDCPPAPKEKTNEALLG